MTQRLPADRPSRSNRRDFLKTTSALAAAGALAGGLSIGRSAHAAGDDLLKIGLIGCGGRGTGAAVNALGADKNCKLVAMADAFGDRLQSSLDAIKKQAGDKVAVEPDHCFVGLDAGEKLIQSGVDVVLLCEPPHFRPMHLKAAIEAGKHVFSEKPVAVDAPGVRSVLASAEEAKKKNLNLVAGLCWRYDYGVRETMKRVLDGAIGEIKAIQETYLTGTALASPAAARLDRNGVPVAQLVLLHLALRRLQRRAARPQPRQGRLGDARRAAGAGVGPGRTPGPRRPEVRRHLRPPRRRLRVSQRRAASTPTAARWPAATATSPTSSSARKGRANILQAQDRGREPLALHRPQAQHVRRGAPGVVRRHPLRQDDQQRRVPGPQHDAGHPRPHGRTTPARR